MRHATGFRMAAAIACTFLLAGCGNFDSIFRSFDTDDDSVSIDAKQRIVIIAKKASPPASGAVSMVCAEPSPDALSAMSAAMTASGSYKEVSAQLAASFSETASNIGLRTQTIQLLRDGMYRACEAYMNGAITALEYSKEQRRYQILMAGLMAIEQLTGVVTPKQVVLRGESAASAGTNLLQAQKNLNEATTSLRDTQKAAKIAKEDLDTAQKALTEYKKPPFEQDPSKWDETQKGKVKELEEKVNNAKTVLGDKEQAVVNAEKTVKEMEAALEAARSLSAKTSAGGNIDSSPSARQIGTFNEQNTNTMIAAVQNIVKDMFKPDFIYECLATYSSGENLAKLAKDTPTSPAVNEMNSFCAAILGAAKANPDKYLAR